MTCPACLRPYGERRSCGFCAACFLRLPVDLKRWLTSTRSRFSMACRRAHRAALKASIAHLREEH